MSLFSQARPDGYETQLVWAKFPKQLLEPHNSVGFLVILTDTAYAFLDIYTSNSLPLIVLCLHGYNLHPSKTKTLAVLTTKITANKNKPNQP